MALGRKKQEPNFFSWGRGNWTLLLAPYMSKKAGIGGALTPEAQPGRTRRE